METKKEFRWFTIFEYEKEQEYLRARHREGWKFVRVTGLGSYHFEACEPADVAYALDYNEEGLAHKEEYVRMFADCGWEYLQDFFGYSYFRKPVSEADDGDTAIFCDDESRLAMMERVIKGRMLPLLILFCCVLLPQFVLNMTVYHNYFVTAFLGIILGIYIAVFAAGAVMLARYRSRK